MADFTWSPDFGFSMMEQPRVRLAQFDDGYSQRSGDGINTILGKWDLKFSNRTTSEASAILSFLRGKAGVTSFTFDDAEGTTRTVICSEWSSNPVADGVSSVSATFQEVMG